MKVPWEDKLPCAALALLVLAVFYGIYFAKMLAQKRRGIQTRQIGRRREKDIHTVEVLMSLATLGAPLALLLIDPLYIIFSKIGLIDSHLSLIICDVAFVIPFAVWMLKGFFDSIPYSLEESAQIDGCTMVQAARLVVIPLTLPGVASVAIYSAILNWSEYLFSRTFITDPRNWMITVGITSYMGEHNIIWGEIMAAAAISILPIILVFVLLSKYLISGMTAGAVKG